jgi:hypothetical protein
MATLAGAAARDQTSTTMLAAAKLEQLRSLTWAYDPSAASPIPRSDTTANVSVEPPDDSGTGLLASPSGTLTSSMPPFVDYLDVQGRWLGNGTTPPSSAAFIRRWSVEPLPEDPQRALILTVRVTTVAAEAQRGRTPWRGRSGQEALIAGLKTRKDQ